MNRPAIRDLLGTVLCQWYQSAAAWVPPGVLSSYTCDTCSTSLAADAIDFSAWPHDLMHELATSLGTMARQISESWAADECSDGYDDEGRMRCVVALLRSAVIEHRDDMLDVLEECVEPTLTHYLETEAARGLAGLAEWSNGTSGR
ncbi:MAG: hypothetical protein ACKVOG_00650 [Rhodoglobus sp.]